MNDTTADDALTEVGPRLRRLRQERDSTLTALSRATGISVSTLSRLESGQRKPSLELLLPIARAHQVTLDELVAPPKVPDPRIRTSAQTIHGRKFWPLTRQPGGLQAYKMALPGGEKPGEQQVHDGYEWLFVLSGEVRLILAEHDVTLKAGEAAEFDTRVPHWFGSAGAGPAELISLFGSQGERIHVRARSRPTST